MGQADTDPADQAELKGPGRYVLSQRRAAVRVSRQPPHFRLLLDRHPLLLLLIIVMCPCTPEMHHLFDRATLSQMRFDAVLVNCSRAKVVDNQALYQALSACRPAAAALDDVEEESVKLDHWTPALNPSSASTIALSPHASPTFPRIRSRNAEALPPRMRAPYCSGRSRRTRSRHRRLIKEHAS